MIACQFIKFVRFKLKLQRVNNHQRRRSRVCH